MPLRFMAREGRVRRRMLSEALLGLMRPLAATQVAARIVFPSGPGDPYYVLLLVPHTAQFNESDYRLFRRNLVEVYCRVLRHDIPDASNVVGLAMEPFDVPESSQDAAYFDFKEWSHLDGEHARELKAKYGLLRAPSLYSGTVDEYPL